MAKEKAIVISIDAMFNTDLDVMKDKKNIGSLLKRSSRVDYIHCVYPTYTYPCHA